MSALDPETIYAVLRDAAARHPEDEALLFGADRLLYRDLLDEVDRTARALLASGVTPGDRVAMLSTTRPEYWTVFLACAAVGATWVGLGTRNRLDELRHVACDAEPRLLIGIAEFEGRDYRPDLEALASEVGSVEELIVLGEPADGAPSFDAWLQTGAAVPRERVLAAAAGVRRNAPALIVYTSGTTGRPKGAMLSHHGLVAGNRAQEHRRALGRPREICSFPINHVACVGDTCVANLVLAGTLILTERFSPREQLELIERERVTIWGGIPTMVQMVLADPEFDRFDLSSVRVMGWGGAAMPRETIERLQAIAPTLTSVYGLTETTVNVTWTPADAGPEMLTGSIGKPGEAFPCRIVDAEGERCGTGEAGEIQFRASTNMLGYWRNPEATAAAFTPDGWLRTGDVGAWREDGAIALVGRMAEVFKSGGFNVYAREVEQAIEEHDDVAYAALVPRPDPLYGEVGHAFVVAAPGSRLDAADVELFARARLANYKVPKFVELVDALPTLANGKIDKRSLRDRLREPVA